MTAEEAALIVALIGVTGTLAANVPTTRANRRGAAIDELRRRTADAFREAFLIQHALEWVTWHARNDPEALTGEMKQEYATEVHRAFPALLGAMAGTAALSIDVYQRLQPILQALYDAEEKVALALRVVDAPGPGRDKSIQQLGALLDEAQRLYRDLPMWIAEVMALAADVPTATNAIVSSTAKPEPPRQAG